LKKLEYLRPRWYGSIKDMIDFGRQCTQNTNWITTARLLLVDAHYEVSREIQDRRERAAYWKQPEVWPDIKETYDQWFKLYPKDSYLRQYYARYAAWCGHWPEFEAQMKLSSSTNYDIFGGVEQFNRMMQDAQAHRK
jgi:hypothetical protein